MQNNLRKVCMYIDVMHRGGAQRVMANLAQYFDEKGVKVILITDFPPQQGKPEYDLPQGVERLYLRKSLGGNPLLKNIERVKVLRTIVKAEKPDIVLSFLGHPNVRMLLATLGLKCKKIVSVRNDPNKEYAAGGVKKKFAQTLFGLADGIVFQTRDAASYFPEKVQSKSKIIMNPVAERFYENIHEEKTKDIITVGRLEPQKNHRLLINAFSNIAQDFPDQNLVIYGEGNLRQDLEKLVEDLDLKNRVLFPGDTKDVPEKLAQSRLFVLSSDYEGMPNALLEAMAVGVPCISTDCPCGGPREIIAQNISGVLVPCNDVETLTKELRTLLADPVISENLGNEARKKAQEFLPAFVYKQWEDYFSSIVNAAD